MIEVQSPVRAFRPVPAPGAQVDARRTNPAAPSAAHPSEQPAPAAAFDRSTGLCMNCALQSHCTFPVPVGGVWHCEEYA